MTMMYVYMACLMNAVDIWKHDHDVCVYGLSNECRRYMETQFLKLRLYAEDFIFPYYF